MQSLIRVAFTLRIATRCAVTVTGQNPATPFRRTRRRRPFRPLAEASRRQREGASPAAWLKPGGGTALPVSARRGGGAARPDVSRPAGGPRQDRAKRAEGIRRGGSRYALPSRPSSPGSGEACRKHGPGRGDGVRGTLFHRGLRPPYPGVTRYASKTALSCRSAESSERRSLTSPSSAVYQFFAIPSSTVPP